MEKIIFLFLFVSCVSTSSYQLDPATFYRHDLCFKVKDQKFCGVGVLPYQDKYEIEVRNDGQLNYFSVTTCHREETSENPDSGIFRAEGKTEIKYYPKLEKDKTCPMYVSVYNRTARHSWGMIAFENPRFQLEAIIHCNGTIKKYKGVSICQSREDLIQRIEFDEAVTVSKGISGPAQRDKDCPELKRIDEKTFEFNLPYRECRYAFKGKDKIHTFYGIGYEEIVIKE